MSSTLWQVVRSVALRRGAAPAVVSPSQKIALSYEGLRDQARGVCDSLRSHGVRRGDVVATDLPNVAEGLVLQVACSRLGAAVATAKDARGLEVPIRTAVVATPESWLLDAKTDLEPLVAGSREVEAMFRRGATPGADYNVDDGDAGQGEDALGYFGSKKALLTHGEALRLASAMRAFLRLAEADRCCVSITLYHAFGIGSACLAVLSAGATVVLPAVGGLHGCGVPSERARATLATMVGERCSVIFADSHTLKALNEDTLAEARQSALTHLRAGVCKVGSGSDILDGTLLFDGVLPLATLGKRT